MAFRYVRSRYNGLTVLYTLCMAGEEQVFRSKAGPRSQLAHVSYFTGGSFEYDKPDGSRFCDIVKGMDGDDIPPFPVDGDYVLRAAVDGAAYFCISEEGKKKYVQRQRIDLAASQQTVIQKGHVAIIDEAAGIRVVVAGTKNVQIDGPCKGLEVWV